MRTVKQAIQIAAQFYDPTADSCYVYLQHEPKTEYMCWALEKAFRHDILTASEVMQAHEAIREAISPYRTLFKKLSVEMNSLPDEEKHYRFWIDRFGITLADFKRKGVTA